MALLLLSGCDAFLNDADREVYRLIEERQKQAIGANPDARRGRPGDEGRVDATSAIASRREYAPHPVDNAVPESFRTATTQPATAAAEAAASSSASAADFRTEGGPALSRTQPALDEEYAFAAPTAPTSEPTTTPATATATAPTTTSMTAPERTLTTMVAMPSGPQMSLADALAYAFKHSREFQSAKEELYLAALDLTLERHLWTPRAFSELSSEYNNFGTITDYDQTLDAVAQAGVRQRLPYGGEITASVINTLMRDARNRVNTGAAGQVLLEANIPLLRGAGTVALESRYQAERNLIYAIRTFEVFRRNLAVGIAGDYFDLQRLRQEITNAEKSVEAFTVEADRARGLWQAGWRIQLDVQRADQDRLFAENTLIDALEAYQSALDEFKVRIGMPTEAPLDVPPPIEPGVEGETAAGPGLDELQAAIRMPAVTEDEAIRVAHRYRLDLINDYDRIGDAERGIDVAENNLLPDLQALGTVAFNTDPAMLRPYNYSQERTTYQAGLRLELPLDRKAERNALKASHIRKDQALRDYEGAKDFVALQVRRAMRVVYQQQNSLEIQIRNRNLALERVRAAHIQAAYSENFSNRDLIEAERDLLSARNRLAQAQSRLNLSILQFKRDTGTLRVDDEGKWTGPASGMP